MRRTVQALGVLVLAMLGLFPVIGHGQQVYTVGTGTLINGTTGNPAPYTQFWEGNHDQYMYKADELQALGMSAGRISGIAFNIFSNAGVGNIDNLRIRIGTTNRTWMYPGVNAPYFVPAAAGEVAPTEVFYQQNVNLGTGWFKHDFPNPWQWDGVSHIVVEVCRYSTPYTVNARTYYTNYPYQGGYRCIWQWNDGFPILGNCTWSPNLATYISNARPNIQFSIQSGIEASFPDDVDPRRILRRGDLYDGSDALHPKPSITFRQALNRTVNFTYKLVGPLPAQTVVYEGRRNGSTPIYYTGTASNLFTYQMTEAVGIAGRADGALITSTIPGGTYRVDVTYVDGTYTQVWQKEFNIAFPNDLTVRQIRSPLQAPQKYPRGVGIPVSCRVQNVGLNDQNDFSVTAVIKSYPAGATLYTQTLDNNLTIKTGEFETFDFPTFAAPDVGQYSAEFCVTMNNAFDEQAINDCMPQTGVYLFRVLHNEEVSASEVVVPRVEDQYYANRPFEPVGRVTNNGILDLTDVPVTMTIYKLPGRVQVYQSKKFVPDVSATEPGNSADQLFAAFTPAEPGQYEACLKTEMPGDGVATNNEVCKQFTVNPNLSGVYTIGTLKSGQPRNYTTIKDAVDDLFRKGVSGPVTFELTDATYLAGDATSNNPAVDFRTTIIGVSPTNKITFAPSLDRSLTKGSITITLQSAGGYGFMFGQSYNSVNPLSVRQDFQNVNQWANSAGNIRFDGGLQKSIRVQLSSSSQFRAPFYLSDGSKDIEIRNCLITSTGTASYQTSIPSVNFVNNQFTYEPDVRTISGQTVTYTAGIVSRAKLPVGRDGQTNAERIDTIRNTSNKFVGNEITNYGYGVVTLGIGTAIKTGVNQYLPYYNAGTEITNNTIYNVRRAGVFSGYEDGITIRNNRIYNVGITATGGTQVTASGIIAGGEKRYHNINLNIDGNEISGVVGDLWARGITIEQVRNIYPSVGASGSNSYFPNTDEASLVKNNVIWGLRRAASSAHMAGVHLFTQRLQNATGIDAIIKPSTNNESYFTKKDMVVNNTVVMTDDGVSGGTGLVTAIGVQHSSGTTVKNNAVMMRGTSGTSSLVHSAVLWEGVDLHAPSNAMQLVSDRNAYELGNAGLARVIEITPTSVVVSMGSQTEYENLSQWRSWNRQDLNSVTGALYADHELLGVSPNQRLRVKTNPAPKGSVMSNRGERLLNVTTDVDGTIRGSAQAAYDLGADEFDGQVFVSDLEVIDISKPSIYRSSTGTASDAEYVMTKAPVDVTSLVRNNGSLSKNNAPVRVRIYLETSASNNAGLTTPTWNATPVVDRTTNVNLNPSQSKDVVMGIQNFTPSVYASLSGYTVPSRFASMTNSVTPRYRVEVSVASDENNTNNTMVKVVRYYLQRAGTRVIVSARGSANDLSGTPSQASIAGRLNADSLIASLNKVGFVNNPTTGEITYDVFERSAWEERAVDYSMYRTMFHSSDPNKLSRYERDDLRAFIASGSQSEKKNLALSSQDVVRNHIGMDPINDEMFVRNILRVTNQTPGTPVPSTLNYNGKRVRGLTIARNTTETIKTTSFAGDANPNPALVRLYSDATTPGIAGASYVYVKGDRETTNDSLMGSAAASLAHNMVFLGVDWRHWQYTGQYTGGDRVIRGIVDFFETNGGTVLPVELLTFDADARGTTVDVAWTTASEQNSDHFIVERADITRGGSESFDAVATVAAAGNSTITRDYLHRDQDVAPGTYLYRLRMVDLDGSIEHSQAVQVVVGGTDGLAITSAQPMPMTGMTTVAITAPAASDARVELVDIAGRAVMTIHNGSLTSGLNTLHFDASALAAGAYTIVVTTPDGTASLPVVARR